MASATRHILYQLDLGGSLSSGAAALQAKIRGIGDAADRTSARTKSMGDLVDVTFRKMGGAFGTVGDVVFDFGGALNDATKGIGGAAGAAAGLSAGLAVAAAGTAVGTKATKDWLDSAVQANQRLKEAGLATAAQTAVLDDYAASSKRLDLALDQVTVTAASLIAGPFADMLDTFRGLLGLLPALVEGFEAADKALNGYLTRAANAAKLGVRGMLAAATLGGSEALRFGVGLASDIGGTHGGTDAPTSAPVESGGSEPSTISPGRTVEVMPKGGAVVPVPPHYSEVIKTIEGITRANLGPTFLEAGAATDQLVDALNEGSKIAPSVQQLTGWGDKPGSTAFGAPAVDRTTAGEFLRGDAPKGLSDAADFASLDAQGPMLGQIGAMFGPMGAAIGGLADNFRNLPDILSGIGDQLVQVLVDLPAVLVELIPMVITELIPKLLIGIVKAIADILNPFKKKDDGASDDGKETFLESRSKSKFLENQRESRGYAVGSAYITHDQTAQLHRGERVVTAEENRRGGGMGGITINVSGASDPVATARAVAAELRRLQGSFGVNLSLDPAVS